MSIILLVVIVVGTVQFFTIINHEIEQDQRTELAWTNMGEKMAKAIEFEYDAILDSMPETSVPLILNGIQAYRSTIVSLVDDPLDGLAPEDVSLPDYLNVTVKFAWLTPDNITDSLSCSFSAERFWDY